MRGEITQGESAKNSENGESKAPTYTPAFGQSLQFLQSWRSLVKNMALFFVDALTSATALYLAHYFTTGQFALGTWSSSFFIIAASLIILRALLFLALRVYSITVRYIGLFDCLVLLLGTMAGSVIYCLGVHLKWLPFPSLPVFFLELPLSTGGIIGVRTLYRVLCDTLGFDHDESADAPERILILGAGQAGVAVLRNLRRGSTTRAGVIGFLDDDLSKQSRRADGIPVLGSIARLPQIAQSERITQVIIALPQRYGTYIREILQQCDGLDVGVQILSDQGRGRWRAPLGAVRPLAIEDLLSREPVPLDTKAIASYITGERVLITGGGGSIGSELARQILAAKPAEILLLGRGENSVYELEQELKRERRYQPTCLIADIRDYDRLERLLNKHRPTVIFHAAAHKHVPLMEGNPEEAIINNVLGTRNLARIATKIGVKRFVMISSDKAVNPTSIMGASKRIAEMVVQAESQKSTTLFSIVRFGNVLGSRGSVIPLMQKQILAGGPVTVTHKDINRYFMLIPEAAQLVVQAGALADNGTIYLLDMGQPVKIIDLASDLIRLMGKTPGKDIEIKVTGLRPGEKLYEELLTAGEGTGVTRYDRIFVAPPAENTLATALELQGRVEQVIQSAKNGEVEQMMQYLRELVPTYGEAPTQPVASLDLPPVGIKTRLDLKAA